MEKNIITGKVVKLGDNIDTDVISPARWMREGLEVLKLHTMEAVRPDFYKDVAAGDIIVAGGNFGCGSHREPATAIIQVLGIGAIVADSISRIYYRNAVAFGIPAFAVPGVSKLIEEGQRLEIKLLKDKISVKNLDTGKELYAPPIPDIMAKVLNYGGIYNLLKEQELGGGK